MLAAALPLASSACSSPVVAPIGLDGRMVTRDFAFVPDTFAVRVGEQSSIVLENEDKVTHNFGSDALQVSSDVEAGGSIRINFMITSLTDVPEDMTVSFACRFHHFEGMRGTVRIEA